MTIYNRPQFYKEALDSLANQTDKNFELLIFSNVKIDYDLKKFNSVKIFTAPESVGLMYSQAIKNSYNDKIAFLDDDDVFSPDKIEYLNNKMFGYLHNRYYKINEGEYNPGKGFNLSSISINKKYFSTLSEQLADNPELGVLIDSFIYWEAVETHVPIKIIEARMTGYRYRSKEVLKERMISYMEKQLEILNLYSDYFKSKEVQGIIRDRIISNKLMLASYKIKQKITLSDMLYILKHSDHKIQKTISYILTQYLGSAGFKIINAIRGN